MKRSMESPLLGGDGVADKKKWSRIFLFLLAFMALTSQYSPILLPDSSFCDSGIFINIKGGFSDPLINRAFVYLINQHMNASSP